MLDGEITFGIGADEVVAHAGTFLHVPGATTHWFRFGAGGGSMISMTSRAGASAFFAEAAQKVDPVDPDLGELVAIATSHGLDIPVPSAPTT